LHPEDKVTTENELKDITIKNVLTDNLYNDLGFSVGERLIIFLEAQSTWTVNIIIRVLLYLAQTYHDYFERTNQNLYKGKKVIMPKPELYVVYTGERGDKPDVISLSEEFFDGEKSGIDIKVRVIYENDSDSIINQYIIFSKVYDEQRKKYGRTRQTITETIRICKNRNVLKEYLESREQEVVTIMMSLYDEEEIMKSYIKSERYEAEQIATKVTRKETAINMIKKQKYSLEDIAEVTDLPIEEVKKLEEEIMQLS
jgi:hypothetical protein